MHYNLEEIAQKYNVAKDFDAILLSYDFTVAKDNFFGRKFLELGCATGESTCKLLQYADSLDVVEGSVRNIEVTKTKITTGSERIQYFSCLWEDYDFPKEKYSDVIWFHGIEHLESCGTLLKKIYDSIIPGGRLHVVTPNAYSLHRQVGVAMGMLGDVHELNERDKTVGHYFVFDAPQVRSQLLGAGFAILKEEGIMIKPLPNAKMQEVWAENPRLVDGFFALGKQYKDLAAEMYFCATKKAMPIKFLDLTAQYPLIREDITKKFNEIIDGASFVSGKYVKMFEEDFARYCGVKHCIAVNNGTSALYLALMGLGVKPGDEVILPVNTFIATAEAVSLVGATPVFVDMDEFYNIDVNQIETKITSKTKVILPVHLYGQCVNMDAIVDVASRHHLLVVEDACQAHGAMYKNKRAGSMGVAGAFSFYPGKNLGAWGEGGAVVTNNDELAEKIRLMREHGSKVKYQHEILGSNFRINEFQGAVLHTKLPFLDTWNENRRKNAALYLQLLSGNGKIILPKVLDGATPVWHLFVVRVKNRDAVLQKLKERNVQCGIHYPYPLHLTPVYKEKANPGDFPLAEAAASEILSLPMYAELTPEEIHRAVEELQNVL